ncbi:MAG: hypothetical protein AAFY36_11120 [Bacteroidota bacterium]
MRLSILFSIICMITLGCESCDDENAIPVCGTNIVLAEDIPMVEDTPVDIEATIDGLCMNINIINSGCDTDLWTASLYSLGEFDDSNPPRSIAYLRFSDSAPGENQPCRAVMEKTFEFDVSPYLLNSTPSILSIDDTDITLLVE